MSVPEKDLDQGKDKLYRTRIANRSLEVPGNVLLPENAPEETTGHSENIR
jgi:hypothetical protein